MDEFDRKILRVVQHDARSTADVISERVGLSPPAVQKRLKKLRETGFIEREIAVLAAHKLDRNLTVIVEVSLERENIVALEAFKRRMRGCSQVQQCYYTTGDTDFTLILQLHDMQEYEAFTNENFF